MLVSTEGQRDVGWVPLRRKTTKNIFHTPRAKNSDREPSQLSTTNKMKPTKTTTDLRLQENNWQTGYRGDRGTHRTKPCYPDTLIGREVMVVYFFVGDIWGKLHCFKDYNTFDTSSTYRCPGWRDCCVPLSFGEFSQSLDLNMCMLTNVQSSKRNTSRISCSIGWDRATTAGNLPANATLFAPAFLFYPVIILRTSWFSKHQPCFLKESKKPQRLCLEGWVWNQTPSQGPRGSSMENRASWACDKTPE